MNRIILVLAALATCGDNCNVSEEDVLWDCECDRTIETGPMAGDDVFIHVICGPAEPVALATCEASVLPYIASCSNCICEPTSDLCP